MLTGWWRFTYFMLTYATHDRIPTKRVAFRLTNLSNGNLLCRHVVNGEILGVSLLLEDVLQNGLPDIFTQQPDDSTLSTTGQRSRPSTSTSRRPPSRHGDTHDRTIDDAGEAAVAVETGLYGDIPKGTISFSTNPKAAVKLINLFLLACSRLELLKTDWGCRKLGVNEIFSSKLYRTLWWVVS